MDYISIEALKMYGISLTDNQCEKFLVFENSLIEWNSRFNLTAIQKPQEIRYKHFLDSMSCVLVWKDHDVPNRIIDIGTGAGFPGIVLKILIPDIKLTLVESVGKKVDFCKHIVTSLGLSEVEVVQGRAESLAKQSNFREQYDCAVCRAVAPLPILTEYLLPFVRIDGEMIALKGNHIQNELRESSDAIKKLGGRLEKNISYTLPGESDARHIICINKITNTPKIYPRDIGVPKKSPL